MVREKSSGFPELFSTLTAKGNQQLFANWFDKQLWCEERDLNPQGKNHMHLKHARMPIPPPSHNPAADRDRKR